MKKEYDTAIVCGNVRAFTRALPRHPLTRDRKGRVRNLATLRRRAALRVAAWGFAALMLAVSTTIPAYARGGHSGHMVHQSASGSHRAK